MRIESSGNDCSSTASDRAPAQHAQSIFFCRGELAGAGRCSSVAASTGSACHAADHVVSGLLAAMGLTAQAAAGAVRLSLGRFTTEAEIESAAATLIGAWKSLTA